MTMRQRSHVSCGSEEAFSMSTCSRRRSSTERDDPNRISDSCWRRIPTVTPYERPEQKEVSLRQSFDENIQMKPFRGRNSDPESPPSDGVLEDSPLQPYDLEVPQQDQGQGHSYTRLVSMLLVLLLLSGFVWTQRTTLQRALGPPPPPQSSMRQYQFGGHQKHFIDVKICESSDCHADCHALRMDSSRRSIVTGPRGIVEAATGVLEMSCDRDYFVSMAVCDNPGKVAAGGVPPFYSFYHDEDKDSAEFALRPDQICKREYPQRPLHLNIRHAVNTTVHFTLCGDGNVKPEEHFIKCMPSSSLPKQIPGGNYRSSCNNCRVIGNGDGMRCNCRTASSDMTDTFITKPHDCEEELQNMDGCLRCETPYHDAEECTIQT